MAITQHRFACWYGIQLPHDDGLTCYQLSPGKEKRQRMFEKILIANRGAIACRIIRTLRRMGLKSVAVYTEADGLSRHGMEADEAFCIGSGAASESYLRADKILDIARHTGADA